ncbi:MAG: DNA-formamidopyrimidine glycosylase family protein [Chloroflexota bacterium]
MPELPEIRSRAGEMHAALVGKTIQDVHVLQPKCLNLPEDDFHAALAGATVNAVSSRGKWICVETSQGWLLLNLGMGGEILLTTPDSLPEKRRLVFDFTDGDCLAINFWWFGHAHFASDLAQHAQTRELGPNALDLGAEQLWAMIQGRRGRLKTFLLDQNQVAGIGNAYIHDILFLAGLHPLRPLNSLSPDEVEKLAQAIQDGLLPSLERGGAFYEQNLYGQPGGFTAEMIRIGYREGQPCPRCAASIEKIKTGGTSSFICPQCQPLPH